MSRAASGDGVTVTDADYELLRGATETYREELLVRLCGEVGLRSAEVTRIRSADLLESDSSHEGTFLRVRGDDGREAYVPGGVAHELHQYVRSKDLAPDARIVDVSPRRVQMLVKGVARRAATRHDRPGLAAVTPSALRRLFARRLLETHGVDPNVVCAVGGWERLDGLFGEPEDPPRERITAAFEAVHGTRAQGTGRLATVVEAIDGVGACLTEAGTPESLRERVCECLVAGEAYEAAWLTEPARHRQGITVRTHAGDSPDRFEGANDSTVVRQARQTGAPMVAPDRPGVAGDQEGRGMLAAIPVRDGETRYGVLVLRTANPDAFTDPERTALDDLGRRIGHGITAANRRHLLAGDSVVRLALGYADRRATFVDLSAATECAVELEGVVPGENGAIVTFVRARGAAPGPVLEHLAEHDRVRDARIIRSYETESLLEVVLAETSPAGICVSHGGTITALTVDGGRATLVGEFPPALEVRSVVERLRRDYPTVELHRKRERAEPAETGLGLQRALAEDLTDKQRSVLRGAYHAGYFEWPRGSTAEELAESLGVSSPTLHNHLRRAQQKLVGTALGED